MPLKVLLLVDDGLVNSDKLLRQDFEQGYASTRGMYDPQTSFVTSFALKRSLNNFPLFASLLSTATAIMETGLPPAVRYRVGMN